MNIPQAPEIFVSSITFFFINSGIPNRTQALILTYDELGLRAGNSAKRLAHRKLPRCALASGRMTRRERGAIRHRGC